MDAEARLRCGAVKQLLEECMSEHEQVRNPAVEKLKAWEEENLFALSVTLVAMEKEFHLEVRTMAAVVLKGVISRQWKRLRPGAGSWNGIADAEKERIRDTLIQFGSQETSKRVASQLVLSVGEIIRIEWPSKWSEFFPTLVNLLRQGRNLLVCRRALQMIIEGLKQLKTKRIPMHRKQFSIAAKDIIQPIHDLWQMSISELFRDLQPTIVEGQQSEIVQVVEIALLCTKALNILVTYGFSQEDFSNGPLPLKYLEELCVSNVESRLMVLSRECKSWPWVVIMNSQLLSSRYPDYLTIPCMLTKLSRSVFLTILEVQENMSLAFLPFLDAFLNKMYIAAMYFMDARPSVIDNIDPEVSGFDEKLGVRAINFLVNVLNCSEYKDEDAIHQDKLITSQGDVKVANGSEVVLNANAMLRAFFTPDRLQRTVRNIISRAFILTQANVEEWLESPEEFAMNEEELSPTFAFRPACENLLTTLLDRYTEDVAPLIISMVQECEQSAQQNQEVSSANYVSRGSALRESCFLAIGLCAYWLEDRMPFSPFLKQAVFPILGSPGDVERKFDQDVLRRRALWLLRCIMFGIEPALHAPLIDFLLGLIESSKSVDLVVRIAAAKTFHGLLASPDVGLEKILPFQSRSITALLLLSGECGTSNARVEFMQTLINLLRRVEGRIVKSLNELLQPINNLWSDAEGPDWSLWKIATLELFASVVESISDCTIEEESVKLNAISQLSNILVPLIHFCTDKSNEEFACLSEPAVTLWSAIAKSTNQYTEPLHRLLGKLGDVLRGNESSLFSELVDIVEAHVMFDIEAVLHDYGSSELIPFFERFILQQAIKTREEVRLLRVVEVILRSRSRLAWEIFSPMLASLERFAVREISQANTQDKTLCVSYLSLVARAFLEFGSPVAISILNGNADVLILIDAWIHNYSIIGSTPLGSWRRKLWALVLCQQLAETLPADSAAFQARFSLILNIWAEVYAEMSTEEQRQAAEDRLFESQGPTLPSTFYQKRRKLFYSDIAYVSDLRSTLNETLHRCQQTLPPGTLQTLLQADASLATLLDRLGLL